MATDKVFIEALLEKMLPLDVVAKPMFGEFGLYFKGKNFALVCENTLFIKVTEPGARLAGKITKASPYPGAKPAFQISKAKVDDHQWLLNLIAETSDALPAPNVKKKTQLTIRMNDNGDVLASTRLRFEPLTVEQGEAFARGEREAQPWAPDFPTDGDRRQAQLLRNDPQRAVSPENVWGPYTLVEKDSDLCIGGIGFKGRPDAAGAVEIGYGIATSRQGQGFMTEAVGRFCAFARRQGALSVSAETDAANIASQRVLGKNGFMQVSSDSASIWWHLDL